jgi:hypothetical protein
MKKLILPIAILGGLSFSLALHSHFRPEASPFIRTDPAPFPVSRSPLARPERDPDPDHDRRSPHSKLRASRAGEGRSGEVERTRLEESVEFRERPDEDGNPSAHVRPAELESEGPPIQILRERSETEDLLFTEYRKVRSLHFDLETTSDSDCARDMIEFCEKMYSAFIDWARKPPGFRLWPGRAHVLLINNKAEWETLVKMHGKGRSVVEAMHIISRGFHWCPKDLEAWHHSPTGSTVSSTQINLLHTLNHLFLSGLARSHGEEIIWWLWEGYAWHRSVELFGHSGPDCGIHPSAHPKEEYRQWRDMEDWVSLLKRDVRTRQDEDFFLFSAKPPAAMRYKTLVKAWSLVRFMDRDLEERRKLLSFIEGLGIRDNQARALKSSFRLELDRRNPTVWDRMDREWRTWIKRRPSRWRRR